MEVLRIEFDGSLCECRFVFIPNDNMNVESTIQIESTYSREVEQEDDFGFSIKDSDGNTKYETVYTTKTTFCKYPQDFEVLLNGIEQYLAEKMDSKKLSELNNDMAEALIMKKEQRWKKRRKKNKLKVLHFISSNRTEIKYFKEYMAALNKVWEQKNYKMFCKSEQHVLDVNGEIFFEFENDCGFDIREKEVELEKILLKVSNSNNSGEGKVDYAIEWFEDTYDGYMVSIKNDCESLYRYNCILLCKPNFRDEVQEYDHIIVCSAGIVLIETKNWRGTFDIRSDGQWIQKDEVDGHIIKGFESPKFQMRRHEVLIQKILPTIPVYSLLCFSNPSIIIDGKENFRDYPIILFDHLEEYLTALCTKGIYSKEDIDRMVAAIETHKVRVA